MKTLRVMTCGSVDDGKSTLMGRLLYESKNLFDDQIEYLEVESQNLDYLDFASLLDGLSAEKEQGITIDVAFRYFSTPRRSFIIADTPGHAEYTRNMAVGASVSEVAILLLDVSKGIQEQTRRHLSICQLMGIKSFVFALNKMDLVQYDEKVFLNIQDRLIEMLEEINVNGTHYFIPLSARNGDNVTKQSEKMPWYQGLSLLSYLESLELDFPHIETFTLPVQRITRQGRKGRGIQGQLVSGSVSIGDPVTILPSRTLSKVKALYYLNTAVDTARKGDPVTLYLEDDVDVSRGNLVTNGNFEVGKDFKANLIWVDEQRLEAGKHFMMKLGTKEVSVIISKILGEISITTGEYKKVDSLGKNTLSSCHLSCFESIVFSTFENLPELGRFILMDKMSQQTVACGMITQSLNRSAYLSSQVGQIGRQARSQQKKQKPFTIWFTGLSGAGKSTLASKLENVLMQHGKHTMLLDGDSVRLGLNNNLGFLDEDRSENLRRIAEVARLMNDAGLIVITSTISPLEVDRQRAKHIIGEENFVEVYIATSISECERRDTKGLYAKARRGEIQCFTGIDAPYEIPRHPQIQIQTEGQSIEESLSQLMDQLGDVLT